MKTSVSMISPSTQLLTSQVFHDLISPFSALSTGLDLLASASQKHKQTKDDADLLSLVHDIADLLHKSKQQLQERLVFFRSLLGGEGALQETLPILQAYLLDNRVTLKEFPPSLLQQHPRVSMALCCWSIRQSAARDGVLKGVEQGTGWRIKLDVARVRTESFEDTVVLKGKAPRCPQESYAQYLYQSLQAADLELTLKRLPNSLDMTLHPKVPSA